MARAEAERYVVTPNVARRVPIGSEETEGSNGKTSPDSELGRSTLGELYDIVIKLQWLYRTSVGLLSGTGPRALVSWITWMAILVAWPLVGLGVAYPVGCFIRGAEALGNSSDLIPPTGSPV